MHRVVTLQVPERSQKLLWAVAQSLKGLPGRRWRGDERLAPQRSNALRYSAHTPHPTVESDHGGAGEALLAVHGELMEHVTAGVGTTADG